jgi:MFS family permease
VHNRRQTAGQRSTAARRLGLPELLSDAFSLSNILGLKPKSGTNTSDKATPSRESERALDGVNFLLAGTLAGFGPFVAVVLGDRGWSPQNIGYVLTAGGIAALVAQLPGGELLDAVRSKRLLVGLGAIMLAGAALLMALWSEFGPVLAALVLQGATAGVIGPAIAAISLGLVGHGVLAERLGRNQRFKSAGSLAAAALMGLIGYFISDRAIFFATALLAAATLIALARIRAPEIHFGRSVGAPDHHEATRPPRVKRRHLSKQRLLLAFAASLFLFQMADAAILPLIGGSLGRTERNWSLLYMSALVVVPQILVVLFAPWVGRHAQSWGRRPLLLIGFAVLPIRALLFTMTGDPLLLAAVQVLDGISAMVIGVVTPLIIADLTMGTGRYNLAQGFVGTVAGVGAAVSTTVAGTIAGHFGGAAGFLEVVAVALAGLACLWLFMPETRPNHRSHPRP